jgi:ketosteroid isomerase-like protein
MLTAALAACSPAGDLSDPEIKTIEATLEDYRAAWLRGDAEAVMAHVSDSSTLFLPGDKAKNIVGKASLRSFWFPSSDTSFRITTYQITDQEIHGSGRFAVAQGRSLLSWQTVAHDSVLSAASSQSEYLTVLRKEGDRWRIYRQMFLTRQ